MRVQKDGMQVTWRQAAYMARDSCAAAASAGHWCWSPHCCCGCPSLLCNARPCLGARFQRCVYGMKALLRVCQHAAHERQQQAAELLAVHQAAGAFRLQSEVVAADKQAGDRHRPSPHQLGIGLHCRRRVEVWGVPAA